LAFDRRLIGVWLAFDCHLISIFGLIGMLKLFENLDFYMYIKMFTMAKINDLKKERMCFSMVAMDVAKKIFKSFFFEKSFESDD
jgi:hypothetical protein